MLDKLSSLTPVGFAVLVLRDRHARARAAASRGDLGASAVEWVVITVITISLIAIVSTIIVTQVRSKASQVNLDSPSGSSGP